MRPLTRSVDVIMQRIPLASRWASERWQPLAVELAPPPEDFVHATAVPGSHPCHAEGEGRWRCPLTGALFTESGGHLRESGDHD